VEFILNSPLRRKNIFISTDSKTAIASFNEVCAGAGVRGNEEADRLVLTRRTRTYCKTSMFWQRFDTAWEEAGGMRQSRCLKSKSLMELFRKDLRSVAGLLTGHCQMKRHLHILGLSQDPKCRLCLEDEETPIHVLTQCPALATIGLLWGKSVINPLDIQATRPRRFCGFVRAIKLER